MVASVILGSEQHQSLSCHISRQTLPLRDAPYKGGNQAPLKHATRWAPRAPGDGGLTVTGASPGLRTPHTVSNRATWPGSEVLSAHRSVTEQHARAVLRATAHPRTARSSSLGGCPLALNWALMRHVRTGSRCEREMDHGRELLGEAGGQWKGLRVAQYRWRQQWPTGDPYRAPRRPDSHGDWSADGV